jgi:putative ABC transport system permease protein
VADTISKMLEAMNMIVVVVVLFAGALAVIVLYNLTNINITERIREIATIKVLGFRAKESAAYVFKENLLLSAMGMFIGLFAGKWLLNFVMSQIKVDTVWFMPQLDPPSYVYAIVLTFASALLVDFLLYFKLEKINMAEALKSVE